MFWSRKFVFLLLAALSVLCFCPELPAQAKNRIRYQWSAGRRYVYLYDVAAFYGMKNMKKRCSIPTATMLLILTTP